MFKFRILISAIILCMSCQSSQKDSEVIQDVLDWNESNTKELSENERWNIYSPMDSLSIIKVNCEKNSKDQTLTSVELLMDDSEFSGEKVLRRIYITSEKGSGEIKELMVVESKFDKDQNGFRPGFHYELKLDSCKVKTSNIGAP